MESGKQGQRHGELKDKNIIIVTHVESGHTRIESQKYGEWENKNRESKRWRVEK